MALRDLTGQRFGRLTVTGRGPNVSDRAGWYCRCDCGTRKLVAGTYLTRGHTKSCGCHRRDGGWRNVHDHTGKRFGRLTVVRRVKSVKPGVPVWLCRCDCGKTTRVRAGNLRAGTVASCGCMLRRRGKDSPLWKGGRRVRKDGYVDLRVEVGGEWRTVREHRHLMERKLGRPLLKTENVHHKNGDRSDNRLRNLELWVKVQPAGQRVRDLIRFGVEVLRRYAPDKLAEVHRAVGRRQ